jgi:hypothetical protein
MLPAMTSIHPALGRDWLMSIGTVQGSRFKVQGSGFRVQGSRFGVPLGFGVGVAFRIHGTVNLNPEPEP